MDLVNVAAKFEVRIALLVLEIIAIEFWGLRTHNLGEEEAVGGQGWHRTTARNSVGDFFL